MGKAKRLKIKKGMPVLGDLDTKKIKGDIYECRRCKEATVIGFNVFTDKDTVEEITLCESCRIGFIAAIFGIKDYELNKGLIALIDARESR